MPISDMCSKNVVFVQKGDTLQYAAQLMKKHNIGSVVVTESKESKKPVGMLTDRDIVVNVLVYTDPLHTKVKDIMSTKLVKIDKKTGVALAVNKMELEGVRRLVVVDDEGSACGVVSSDDILQLLARELHGLGQLIERQVENKPPAYLAQGTPIYP